ncbi:MAG TPA: adenosylhomocysteinase, partial [Ruminococcus sp.]|nr:adenosylhomocysteinase [Ruminococcus sp.]
MSFGIQALTAAYLANNRDKLTDKIIYVPAEVDNEVADRKLRFWGIEIDKLTPEQEKYLSSWQVD